MIVQPLPFPSATAEFMADFTGLSWELPGLSSFSSTVYNCGAGSSDVYTVSGPPGRTIEATVRLRGCVELNEYTGGAAGTPSYLYTGATGAHVNVNQYKLIVSSPAQTFWLNNGAFTDFDQTALDYELTFDVDVGATITLQSLSVDNREIKNNTNVSATDDDPTHPIVVAQPYAGQFMQLDAVSAVLLP
jgi:hypothetical protein